MFTEDQKNTINQALSILESHLNKNTFVAKLALQVNSAAVIFAHNHLSNDCTPSTSDKDITRMLCELMALIGVKVLDHIIVGQANYFSFAEEGLL